MMRGIALTVVTLRLVLSLVFGMMGFLVGGVVQESDGTVSLVSAAQAGDEMQRDDDDSPTDPGDDDDDDDDDG